MRPGFFIESPPHDPLCFSQTTLDPVSFRRPWLLPRRLPQHLLELCGQPRFQRWRPPAGMGPSAVPPPTATPSAPPAACPPKPPILMAKRCAGSDSPPSCPVGGGKPDGNLHNLNHLLAEPSAGPSSRPRSGSKSGPINCLRVSPATCSCVGGPCGHRLG